MNFGCDSVRKPLDTIDIYGVFNVAHTSIPHAQPIEIALDRVIRTVKRASAGVSEARERYLAHQSGRRRHR